MRLITLLLLTGLLFPLVVSAQQSDSIGQGSTANDQAEQLEVVQSVLDTKLSAREALRADIKAASADALPELEAELVELNKDIANLRNTFEQVAVGSVDLAIFNEESTEFNWRDEVTQVLMPLMQNLKALTEKPRKIEALKAEIARANQQNLVVADAVQALEQQVKLADNANTKASLSLLLESWNEQREDNIRAIDLAKVKLVNLQKSDKGLWQSLTSGIVGFITGRGLTLILAALAATIVWFAMRFVTGLAAFRARGEAGKTYRTRQRLVHYGFKVITALLMLVAVIVVFYTRGDVLLMGLALLIVAAIILGLRNTIPKFISETRMLLNLGSVREGERVMYQGLPYRVISLNVDTVLRNPELTGVIRLPLQFLDGLVSRPAGKEAWFPASKDDYIVLDGRVLQVTDLTPELIQLENLSGTKTSMPANDFYNLTFDNLTRGSAYSIVSTFGIGYKHQDISDKVIPDTIKQAVSDMLEQTDVAQYVENVAVELKEAGASSLDFWVCVTMSSAAARSYYKISRIIQQTCVKTCTNENWDIPFPQLTLHRETV